MCRAAALPLSLRSSHGCSRTTHCRVASATGRRHTTARAARAAQISRCGALLCGVAGCNDGHTGASAAVADTAIRRRSKETRMIYSTKWPGELAPRPTAAGPGGGRASAPLNRPHRGPASPAQQSHDELQPQRGERVYAEPGAGLHPRCGPRGDAGTASPLPRPLTRPRAGVSAFWSSLQYYFNVDNAFVVNKARVRVPASRRAMPSDVSAVPTRARPCSCCSSPTQTPTGSAHTRAPAAAAATGTRTVRGCMIA